MQTEKSSHSMFAANRVNNGQSHSLDVILIITFLLDIGRHVINFEVCADLTQPKQTFLCLSLWHLVASEDRTISHTGDFYFFHKMRWAYKTTIFVQSSW